MIGIKINLNGGIFNYRMLFSIYPHILTLKTKTITVSACAAYAQ